MLRLCATMLPPVTARRASDASQRSSVLHATNCISRHQMQDAPAAAVQLATPAVAPAGAAAPRQPDSGTAGSGPGCDGAGGGASAAFSFDTPLPHSRPHHNPFAKSKRKVRLAPQLVISPTARCSVRFGSRDLHMLECTCCCTMMLCSLGMLVSGQQCSRRAHRQCSMLQRHGASLQGANPVRLVQDAPMPTVSAATLRGVMDTGGAKPDGVSRHVGFAVAAASSAWRGPHPQYPGAIAARLLASVCCCIRNNTVICCAQPWCRCVSRAAATRKTGLKPPAAPAGEASMLLTLAVAAQLEMPWPGVPP